LNQHKKHLSLFLFVLVPDTLVLGVPMTCPHCGSGDLRASFARLWERPFRLFGFQMYRCRRCRFRELKLPGPLQFRVRLKVDLEIFSRRTLKALPAPAARDRNSVLDRRPPGPIHLPRPQEAQPADDFAQPQPATDPLSAPERTKI